MNYSEAEVIKLISHLKTGKILISDDPQGYRLKMVEVESQKLFNFLRKKEYAKSLSPHERKAVDTPEGIAHCIYFSNGRIWDSTYGFRKEGWE